MSVVSTSSVNSSSSKSHLIDVPTHWHAETQHCLDTKAVSDEARNDIIRTLVTLLIGKYGSKPSRRQCEQASRALILQYPFLKDDLGPGYVSLNCYIYMHASSILVFVYMALHEGFCILFSDILDRQNAGEGSQPDQS